MSENQKLPDEMLIEIFSRLPAKSVGRCRCLSTLWRSRLSNPQFLNLHFIHTPQKQSLILIIADSLTYEDHYSVLEDWDTSVHTVSFPVTKESVVEKLDFSKDLVEVVGSVDGLDLFEDKLGNFILMNPVTREQVFIARPSFMIRFKCNLDNSRTAKMHGFGYDVSSDDYEIVTLGDLPNKVEWIGVAIYSVKSGVWELKDNFPPHIGGIFTHRANGALLNGAIHWLAGDKRFGGSLAIVAFDLESEEFRQVPAPVPSPNYTGAEFCNVFVLEGCLCIVEMLMDVVDAWVMIDYGLQESWVKFTLCVNMQGPHLAKPLCYNGGDEVVVVDQNTMSLIVANVKEQTKKVMLSDRDLVADGCVFVESLVSPVELGSESEMALT